jgi:hypothetical protein
MVAELLEIAPDEEKDVIERTRSQLHLMSLGVPAWDGAFRAAGG